MNKADTILAKIKEEVISSLKKHPKWPDDPFHALSILGEEFGEVSKALLEHFGTNQDIRLDDIRMELIQLGAMCVRMLDGLDKVPLRIYDKRKEQSDEPLVKQVEHLAKRGVYMNPQMTSVLNRGPVKATIVDSNGKQYDLGTVVVGPTTVPGMAGNVIVPEGANKFNYLHKQAIYPVNAVQITPKLWVSREKGEVPLDWECMEVTKTHGKVFGEHSLVLTPKKGIKKHPATNIAKIGDWVITQCRHTQRWVGQGFNLECIDFDFLTEIDVEVVSDMYFHKYYIKVK